MIEPDPIALAISLVMTLFALGIARMFFGNDPEE